MPRVVVVGGGVAGLAAAHRLLEVAPDLEVVLLEAQDRLGGTIRTERVDGFVIDRGPDAIITEKPSALKLVERLGLQDRIVRTQDAHRGAYVVAHGRLVPVPEGFALLAPSAWWPLMSSSVLSWSGKIRAAGDLILPRGPEAADESLGGFVARRLGPEMLERLAQPMVGGIYGTAPGVLSLEATMPRFRTLEREHRSVALGLMRGVARMKKLRRGEETAATGARYGLFISFDGGIQVLTDALAASLPGEVRLSTPVRGLERRGEGFLLKLADGEEIEADGVILATAAHVSARLVEPEDARLAQHLDAIPYGSSVTIALAYRREEIPHPLDAFGFVVPTVEGRSLMACTWSSVKWPGRAPEGMVLLRCFLGGEGRDHAAKLDEETLLADCRRELKRLMGIEAAPSLVRVDRHVEVMPRYRVGHLVRAEQIEARVAALPRLELAGGFTRGVGIPDSVKSGEAAAESLAAQLG